MGLYFNIVTPAERYIADVLIKPSEQISHIVIAIVAVQWQMLYNHVPLQPVKKEWQRP